MNNMQWTDERAEQLKTLIFLISMIQGVNHGSRFIENINRAINDAQALLNDDLANNKVSFMQFLTDLCVADRTKQRDGK